MSAERAADTAAAISVPAWVVSLAAEALPIVQLMRGSHIAPSLAFGNPSNCGRANRKYLGYFSPAIAFLKHLFYTTHVGSRKLRASVIFAARPCVVSVLVGIVFLACAPREVFSAVVMPVSVEMSAIEAIRPWADERGQYKTVNHDAMPAPVTPQPHSAIAFEPFLKNHLTKTAVWDRLGIEVVSLHNQAIHGANTPSIADFVSREFGSRDPFFHCATVSGTWQSVVAS